jgi:hypothetical protein
MSDASIRELRRERERRQKPPIPRRYRGPLSRLFAGRPHTVVLRSLFALKTSAWYIVISGFFEPVFYLFAFGLGVGQLVGPVTGPAGQAVAYAAFIAPALLATSAMNGAIYDATWNVFFKMRFAKIYEGMVATSLGTLDIALGEIMYALLRGPGVFDGLPGCYVRHGPGSHALRTSGPAGGDAHRIRVLSLRHGDHQFI